MNEENKPKEEHYEEKKEEQPVEEKTPETKPSEEPKEEPILETPKEKITEENKPELKEPAKPSFFRKHAWKIVTIIPALLVIFLLFRTFTPTGSAIIENKEIDIELYVMSQCPYGTMAEDALKEVFNDFKEYINFKLEFVGNGQKGNFQSLHGPSEVAGNIVQLCAQKYNPNNFMDMVWCMNKNPKDIPDNWESCATGLNTKKIKECFQGEEGEQLLEDSFKKANSKNVRGSPTMFLNKKEYAFGFDSLKLMKDICKKINDPKCQELPECFEDAHCNTQETAKQNKIGICKNEKCEYQDPVEFEYIILNDETCTDCDTTQLETYTDSMFFGGAKLTRIDISTEKGQELIKKYNIMRIPVIFFDKKIETTYTWKSDPRLQSAFEDIKDHYIIRTGIKLATQELQEELDKLAGKEDNKPQMDFFVMSYCPYGNSAEEAIYEVYKLLKDKAVFMPKYIYYENFGRGGPTFCLDKDDKYCSMHGIQEANQNIRELCVYHTDGVEKWFEFALEMNKECTSENADKCWESIAENLKLDIDAIKSCEKEKSLEYAEADAKAMKLFGASGSPNVYIDGTPYDGNIDPEGYKKALCNAFEQKPAECEETLETASTSQTSVPSTGGCGV